MKRAFLVAGLVVVSSWIGCGGAGSDLCHTEMQCLGGNEKDEAACVSEFGGDTRSASDYGCSDQWDALTECRNEKSKCVADGDQKRLTTRDEQTGQDRCETEARNFDSCIAGASALDD